MKISSDIEYLFVYGTLRKGVELPINKQISKYLEWVGQGEIKGKLYDIGEYPGAVQFEDGKSFIKGDVFKILQVHDILKVLDEYEGFNPNKISDSEYLRKLDNLELNNEKIAVWVYWYNQPINNKIRILDKDYLEYLKKKKTA